MNVKYKIIVKHKSGLEEVFMDGIDEMDLEDAKEQARKLNKDAEDTWEEEE